MLQLPIYGNYGIYKLYYNKGRIKMRIYLNVPYSEKEEAKSLGARWNPTIKKWYINSTTDELPREFLKWECPIEGIPGILKDYIYVIEGQQKCWKCGKQTRVI